MYVVLMDAPATSTAAVGIGESRTKNKSQKLIPHGPHSTHPTPPPMLAFSYLWGEKGGFSISVSNPSQPLWLHLFDFFLPPGALPMLPTHCGSSSVAISLSCAVADSPVR